MGVVKNSFPPLSTYNGIPFIDEVHHVAETHKDDLKRLIDLLEKHDLPTSVCIKLIHIHFHLQEDEIMAFSEFSAPPHSQIPFLGARTPQADTKYYGCHYLVDEAGDLQAFEYTMMEGGVDLALYPEMVAEFCDVVVQRGLQHKFGLAIKSGVAKHGSWVELDYPEKRATFLLPSHIEMPKSDLLVERSTKTQFLPPKHELPGDTHKHTEHYHSKKKDVDENDEPLINGVSTKKGLFLTGMPLHSGTPFYTVVSAMAIAAGA